ncbi:MAG: DUF2182 domain-containing protein, partial [Actinomycetota bacterium]
AYLLRHYRRGPGAAFRLGWGHGLWCLGCCWALMLVMFAVGVADLGWMAALTALMAYEKIGRHGPAVATATATSPWRWRHWSPPSRHGSPGSPGSHNRTADSGSPSGPSAATVVGCEWRPGT